MKQFVLISSLLALAACDPAADLDKPMGTQGALGEANIACIERDGILVGRRGGGVICKLPNGDIVDQMTLI